MEMGHKILFAAAAVRSNIGEMELRHAGVKSYPMANLGSLGQVAGQSKIYWGSGEYLLNRFVKFLLPFSLFQTSSLTLFRNIHNGTYLF